MTFNAVTKTSGKGNVRSLVYGMLKLFISKMKVIGLAFKEQIKWRLTESQCPS